MASRRRRRVSSSRRQQNHGVGGVGGWRRTHCQMDDGRERPLRFRHCGSLPFNDPRLRVAGSTSSFVTPPLLVATRWRDVALHQPRFGFRRAEVSQPRHLQTVSHPLATVFTGLITPRLLPLGVGRESRSKNQAINDFRIENGGRGSHRIGARRFCSRRSRKCEEKMRSMPDGFRRSFRVFFKVYVKSELMICSSIILFC